MYNAPVSDLVTPFLTNDEFGHAAIALALVLALRYTRTIMNGILALDDRVALLARRANDNDAHMANLVDRLEALEQDPAD
jgi:hypothetical protein